MNNLISKLYNRLFGGHNKELEKFYKDKDYLEAYSKHTDQRISQDPKSAIGGKWEEIGELQFKFLLKEGLQPENNMLDIGCGTLRGGQHFIKYLNSGNYTGIDISAKAIEHSKEVVKQTGMSEKKPVLLLNENKHLKFEEFQNQTFDFILAQSVFTHLKPDHIEECFLHVNNIMHEKSKFYFTYFKADEYKELNFKDIYYPFSFFKTLAEKYNFDIKDLTQEYNHPRKQNMLLIEKK